MTARYTANRTPISVSVDDAAQTLGLSLFETTELLDAQVIESHFNGRRRLVDFASLHAYYKGLPTERPAS